MKFSNAVEYAEAYMAINEISREDKFLIGKIKGSDVSVGDIISPADRKFLMIVEDIKEGTDRCICKIIYIEKHYNTDYKVGDTYDGSSTYSWWYRYPIFISDPEFDF
ncbi:MAG: hypothetical protein RR744_00305 [Cellulosilyticaceae bacterium]